MIKEQLKRLGDEAYTANYYRKVSIELSASTGHSMEHVELLSGMIIVDGVQSICLQRRVILTAMLLSNVAINVCNNCTSN